MNIIRFPKRIFLSTIASRPTLRALYQHAQQKLEFFMKANLSRSGTSVEVSNTDVIYLSIPF